MHQRILKKFNTKLFAEPINSYHVIPRMVICCSYFKFIDLFFTLNNSKSDSFFARVSFLWQFNLKILQKSLKYLLKLCILYSCAIGWGFLENGAHKQGGKVIIFAEQFFIHSLKT